MIDATVSYKIRLTTEETYILADKMQEVSQKKLSRRLLAISLRHFGYKIKDISLIVGVSEKTVTKWIKLFLEGGFDALLTLKYEPKESSRLQPHKEAIRQYRLAHPAARLEEVRRWLKEEKGVEVEYSWLYRYIDRYDL
ncbi:MAG: helix-turn-helix domain-containing protein [Bacteroidota bacterium]